MLALGAQGVSPRSHFGGKCGTRGNVKANLKQWRETAGRMSTGGTKPLTAAGGETEHKQHVVVFLH